MKRKENGMALVAVLSLIVILVLLTTALLALSKEHIFQTSKYHHKIVAQSLAEAGIGEALMKLKANQDWGKDPNDADNYLLMNNANTGNAFGISLPGDNHDTGIDYETKGIYYITFDPNAGVPYSTNNLGGGGVVTGWDGRDVPSGKADIIVNVMVNNVVKHIEIIAGVPTGGIVEPVCGGTARFRCGEFTMNSVNSNPPTFHSNASTGVSIELVGVKFNDFNGGKIGAAGDILYGSLPASGFAPKSGTAYIPDIDISDLPDDSNETLLPPGTYTVTAFGLQYRDTSGTLINTYPMNSIIASGVKYGIGDNLEISKNVRVTGNGELILKGAGIKFDDTVEPYLYLGGDSDSNGKLEMLGDSSGLAGNLMGKGYIYSLGDIQIGPDSMSGCNHIDCGAGSNISLYAEGNVTMNTLAIIKYAGLIYTKGDFRTKTQLADAGIFILSAGSLIAKGSIDIDVGGSTIANFIDIEIDDSILSVSPGGSGEVTKVFWQDF